MWMENRHVMNAEAWNQNHCSGIVLQQHRYEMNFAFVFVGGFFFWVILAFFPAMIVRHNERARIKLKESYVATKHRQSLHQRSLTND